jgi:hypothetical protein
VAAKCLSGAIAEWSCAPAPTLPNDGNVLLKVQMLQFFPDQLGNPQP